MHAWLLIPWFKADAWEIPIPGVGTLPVQPFGILVAIGVILGARVAEEFGKHNGISPVVISDMVGHTVIIGFIAAYFLNAAFYNPERFMRIFSEPAFLFSRDGYLGLSSFGGFIGGMVGLAIWYRRRRLPLITVGEAAFFGFPFGWFFGRMGCFVTHDHPGKVSHFFLAVDNYRFGSPPFEPRHDLGLYEVIWSAATAALIVYLAKKRKWPRGFFMALLPLLYVPVRFFLDYLRADPGEGGDARYIGLTPGQWGSLGFFAFGAVLMWRIHRQEPPPVPAHAAWPPPPKVMEKMKKELAKQKAGFPWSTVISLAAFLALVYVIAKNN